jgi:hypothetical protein
LVEIRKSVVNYGRWVSFKHDCARVLVTSKTCRV